MSSGGGRVGYLGNRNHKQVRPQGYKVREATTREDPSQVGQQTQGHEDRERWPFLVPS